MFWEIFQGVGGWGTLLVLGGRVGGASLSGGWALDLSFHPPSPFPPLVFFFISSPPLFGFKWFLLAFWWQSGIGGIWKSFERGCLLGGILGFFLGLLGAALVPLSPSFGIVWGFVILLGSCPPHNSPPPFFLSLRLAACHQYLGVSRAFQV